MLFMNREPTEADETSDDSIVPADYIPTYAGAEAEDVATFWAKTASRLLEENAMLKVKLGDLKMAAHSARHAASELEQKLALSCLVEMADGRNS